MMRTLALAAAWLPATALAGKHRAQHRFHRMDTRLGGKPEELPLPKHVAKPSYPKGAKKTQHLEVDAPGGSQNLVVKSQLKDRAGKTLDLKGKKLGVMVAGNHGQPFGAVGGGDPRGFGKKTGKFMGVHAKFCRTDMAAKPHNGQEESLVANMLVASTQNAAPSPALAMEQLFKLTVRGAWGLTFPRGKKSPRTVQGIDYRHAPAKAYYEAWVVPDVSLCEEKKAGQRTVKNPDNKRDVNMYFVAGPQCNEVATQVSLQLTGNRNCWPGGKNRKQFMLDATVNAMAAGVDAMIEDGVQVAFVAPLATNIYAPGGTPQGKIAQWFGSADDFTRQVLAKVLNAAYKDGKPRGEHLQAVLPIFRRL